MKLARSISFLFLAEFIFYASGYAVHLGAAWMLEPNDYGRYGLVITFTLLIANLIGNGIPIAMSKFLSEHFTKGTRTVKGIRQTALHLQIGVMIVLTTLFFMCAPLFARLLGDPSLTVLFWMASLVIPMYAADAFYFHYFSGLQQFGAQAVLKIVRSIMRVVFILGLTFVFGLTGTISGYVIVPLVVFLVALWFDWRLSKAQDPPQWNDQPASVSGKDLLDLALPVTGFLVLFELLLSFDLYLLKILGLGDSYVGWYNAALTIARIPTFLFYAFTITLLPVVSESIARKDFKRIESVLSNALKFVFLATLPFVVLAISFPNTATSFLFGADYKTAGNYLAALVAGLGLLSFLYVFSFAFKGAGLTKPPVVFAGLGFVVNMVLAVLFFWLWGVEGIALAKVVTGLLIIPVFLVTLHNTFCARLAGSVVWKAFIAAFIMLLIGFLAGDSLLSVVVATPIMLFFYGYFLFFLNAVSWEEIRSIKG